MRWLYNCANNNNSESHWETPTAARIKKKRTKRAKIDIDDIETKGGVGSVPKYRLIDVDGKEITAGELAEKYFSSPEVCFIKADETLRIEKLAEERG